MHSSRGFSRPVWAVVGIALLTCIAMSTPGTVSADDGVVVTPPNYYAQRLGGPIINYASATPTVVAMPVTPRSSRFTGHGQVSVSGSPMVPTLTFAVRGEQMQPASAHLVLTLDSATGPAAIPPIEVTVVDTKVYVHLTGTLAPNGRDEWLLIDGLDNSLPATAASMTTMMGASSLSPNAVTIQTLGDETINGVPTTHQRATVDPATLVGLVNGAATTGSQGARVQQASAVVDFWIGKSDHYLHRATLTEQIRIDPRALTSMGTPATMEGGTGPVDAAVTFTIDFTDFNTPVTITPPATYTKLSDVVGGTVTPVPRPLGTVPPRP